MSLLDSAMVARFEMPRKWGHYARSLWPSRRAQFVHEGILYKFYTVSFYEYHNKVVLPIFEEELCSQDSYQSGCTVIVVDDSETEVPHHPGAFIDLTECDLQDRSVFELM